MSLNTRRRQGSRSRPHFETLEERRLLAIDVGLLQDINPFLTDMGSYPSAIVTVGSIGYFVANDGAFGNELWRTDGTAAGTTLVRDINPGGKSASPNYLTNVNGTLFFVAKDEQTGVELWKSDGTAAGTVRVKDIRAGKDDSAPDHLANVNGTLLFSANDGVHGRELWRSDGTAAGTTLVKDIRSGAESSYSTHGINVSGTLYFLANDGVTGLELWKSDGTAAGTTQLMDIAPGPGSSVRVEHPQFLNANGTLYFVANDGVHGSELWRSSGTSATTSIVADIAPGSGVGVPRSYVPSIVNIGDVVYFAATPSSHELQLWKVEGAAGEATLVKDFWPGTYVYNSPSQLTVVGNTLFFAANGVWGGMELWKSDGTEAGTVVVKELAPDNKSSSPNFLSAVGSHLYFGANDGVNGEEVWRTDGTSEGTIMLEAVPGPAGIRLNSQFRSVAGTVVFIGSNGVNGVEVMRIDDNSTPTLMKDLYVGTGDSGARNFTLFNGIQYFTALDGALWRTDGTSAGTYRVTPSSATSPRQATGLTVADGWLYFTAQNSLGHGEVWRTDGTAAGTTQLTGGPTATSAGNFGPLASANGAIYFTARSGSTTALWKADAGGALAIVPGVQFDGVTTLASTGSALFYVKGMELWKTDGTAPGTSLVKAFPPSHGYWSESLTNVNGVLYFTSPDWSARELWKSDGTVAGTVLVKAFDAPQGSTSRPRELTEVNGVLYFAFDISTKRALWRSDGTLAGTHEVADVGGGLVADIYNRNGTLFFRSNVGATSGEMWYSDGTAAGTVMLSSLMPAGSKSYYLDAAKVGNTIYFGADDGVSGEELWMTDLTVAGTALAADIVPGSGGSSPNFLRAIGNKLIMTATTPEFGREVWAATSPPTAGDYDGSGTVDGDDFLAWQRSFGGAATPVGSGADGDGDGTVGAGDLGVWKMNYGSGVQSVAATAMAAASASVVADDSFAIARLLTGEPTFAASAPSESGRDLDLNFDAAFAAFGAAETAALASFTTDQLSTSTVKFKDGDSTRNLHREARAVHLAQSLLPASPADNGLSLRPRRDPALASQYLADVKFEEDREGHANASAGLRTESFAAW